MAMCVCSRVSGCVDHFAWEEKEAYEYTRNIISTLNYELPEEEEEESRGEEEPVDRSQELQGLAWLVAWLGCWASEKKVRKKNLSKIEMERRG